jgi:hypothetical protein
VHPNPLFQQAYAFTDAGHHSGNLDQNNGLN